MTSVSAYGGITMDRTLTPEESRAFYDHIGARQDTQRFYEDAALDLLVAHADFGSARRVFEFGCGRGRFATRLLADTLPLDATYRGIDISPTMVRIASGRLARWAGRASVSVSDGAMQVPEPSESVDRFVCTYICDLLSFSSIDALLIEARRVLAPGGLICAVNLTHGTRGVARLVSALWRRVFRWQPRLVGGCRPIHLRDRLAPDAWEIVYHGTVTRFGITSEIVVAKPIRIANMDAKSRELE
jgi:ubiquinone/menaquinone biosynthesis C-methylase UbiE